MGVTFTEEFMDNGLLKISLSGMLDAPGAMGVEEQFQKRLNDQGGNVIVDLGGLEYMSSYGLRMLLMAAKGLHDRGGGLYLAAPTPHVMEVIRVAGYDTMFPVYESVSEAVSFLTS
jgi:anti-sigma B factor antagonist